MNQYSRDIRMCLILNFVEYRDPSPAVYNNPLEGKQTGGNSKLPSDSNNDVNNDVDDDYGDNENDV